MSAQAHIHLLEIDEHNSLNLEAFQAPEEAAPESNPRAALRDPIFRVVIGGFMLLFALLGIAVALTF